MRQRIPAKSFDPLQIGVASQIATYKISSTECAPKTSMLKSSIRKIGFKRAILCPSSNSHDQKCPIKMYRLPASKKLYETN